MESMTMRLWVVVAQKEGFWGACGYGIIARPPTKFGDFKIVNFSVDGREVDDIAIIAGDVENCSGVLTRLHSECLTERIKMVERMPAFSVSAQKILTTDFNCVPRDLVAVIEHDPVLTGTVLKIVNSIYFGLSKTIISIKHAVVVLGLNTVRHLAMTIAAIGSLPRENDAGFDMDEYLQHSLCTGAVSRMLAGRCGVPKRRPEEVKHSRTLPVHTREEHDQAGPDDGQQGQRNSSMDAGDALGSLRCDCRAQLQASLKAIAEEGRGVVLYLRQEGRGIGLFKKVAAYSLQDRGLDTVDANLALGMQDDCRDFGVAAEMLHALRIDSVRLMTNNPNKVNQIVSRGVVVEERVPHSTQPNVHNEAYLRTKASRSGHLLTFEKEPKA